MRLLRAIMQQQFRLQCLGIVLTLALLNTACNDANSDTANKTEDSKAKIG